MEYRLEGKMEVILPPAERGTGAKNGLWEDKDFRAEVEAISEEDAMQRATFKIQVESMVESPRNFQFTKVELVSNDELGKMGKFVFENLKRKWLRENYHLERVGAGFKPDELLRPEKIHPAQGGGLPILRYIDPETRQYIRVPQLDFPQKITSLILKVVNDEKEAEAAVDLIFGEVYVEPEMEGDGDHHSMTYGQEVIPVYYIRTEKAFALAKNPEKLRQLIGERMSAKTSIP
jgi:hypothetical protein